jgi:ankyrin repeat protein
MAKLLIDSGCDLSPVNVFGDTPLHLAVASSPANEQIVRILVDGGADHSAITR